MIKIALPKGRLGGQVAGRLTACGMEVDLDLGRRLVGESACGRFRFFLVKPWDVPAYVESGVADLGVAGQDVLLEHSADVYELMDLGLGRCTMAVAGMAGAGGGPTVRVATKYPTVARRYYEGQGRHATVIKLNGSVELAPILGLSDVIVDIVESGDTLRENGLTVLDSIMPISARLVANKAASKFRGREIDLLAAGLEAGNIT